MEKTADGVSERLLDYGVAVLKFCAMLNRTVAGRHLGSQLLRSGTSAGANYEEARGAQSRADFVHKMQVVLKELRESLYWLNLAQRAELVKGEGLDSLLGETKQLCNIVGKSIITAKAKETKSL